LDGPICGEPHDADVDAALHPLTNRFSQKLETRARLVALYALWYNFVRQRKTLRMSPAMAVGIENHL
jgi:hypothetical protein